MTHEIINNSALLIAQAAVKRILDEPPSADLALRITTAAVHAYLEHAYEISQPDVPGYEPLRQTLHQAYDQSAHGKGRERHNKANKPFAQQPIMTIGRMVGIGYPTGQAMKKIQEAVTMAERGNYGASRAEFLGAIVYAAAACILLQENQPDDTI